MNESDIIIQPGSEASIKLSQLASVTIDPGLDSVTVSTSVAVSPSTIESASLALEVYEDVSIQIGPGVLLPRLKPRNPVFSYTVEGLLDKIEYDGASQKNFEYDNAGMLSALDYYDGVATLRREFSYNASGLLVSIAEV
jgi:hypothetical protein